MDSPSLREYGNGWMELFTVERQGSFLRLMLTFSTEQVSAIRQSLSGKASEWESILPNLRHEARLAEHPAELVRDADGGLSVHRWRFPDIAEGALVPKRALVRLGKADGIELRFDRVEMWLFELGFGFLTFEVSLESGAVSHWLALLHQSRYLADKRRIQLVMQDGEDTLETIIARVMASLQPGEWWKPIDIPRTLRSYLVLSVARVSHDDSPPAGRCDPVLERRLLYHVCEQAPPQRRLDLPTSTARGDYVRGDSFEYADGVHFVASREGVAFVAIDRDMTDEFWKSTMVNHLRSAYYLHYVMTQYQRHAIESLRRAVQDAERDQQISEEEWRRVKQRSARVRASGFFVELARTNNHARFERLVRDMAQVDRLFSLTTRAVDDLVALKIEAIEAERISRQKALQKRWEGFATAGAFGSLLLGFLSVNLRGFTTEGEGLRIGLAIALFSGFLGAGFLIGRRNSGR